MVPASPLTMADVSNNNGALSAAQLRGIDVVMAKATEGTAFSDDQYEANRALARQVGARFGAYCFARPSQPVHETFNHFHGIAKLSPGDVYAVDIEVSDGLPAREVAQWGTEFALLGYGAFRARPWVYSDRDFIAAGNLAGLGNCPLWIAAPGPAGYIEVPGWRTTTARQWGIAGGIDRSAVFLTLRGLSGVSIPGRRAAEIRQARRDLRAAARDVQAGLQLLRRFGGGR